MNTQHIAHSEIVIPTLAESNRAAQLMRAIGSVQDQGARALVVVNGNRFDAALVEQLKQRDDIRLIQVAEPSLPNALHVGRCAVNSEFFGFLDDDDYLLPDAISRRESYLQTHSNIDVIICNGIWESRGENGRFYKDPAELQNFSDDPLGTLLRANWMASCGALFRSASVAPAIFLDLTKYAEWTDVAFRLIDVCQLRFLFENTFVIADSPESLSKNSKQARHMLRLLEKFHVKAKTRLHRQRLKQRLCNLHHQIADEALEESHRLEALRHHLLSLLVAPSIGIPKYLLYTRKLLLPSKRHNR